MKDNGWLIFHPVVQVEWVIFGVFLILLMIRWYMKQEINIIISIIFILFSILWIIIVILLHKNTYIKIQDSNIIIKNSIFNSTAISIGYNDIESIFMLDGVLRGRNIYSIHIKKKNQEKKLSIDCFSEKSFNEMKNILIWKWLPVSVSIMKGTKRETEDFNKKS